MHCNIAKNLAWTRDYNFHHFRYEVLESETTHAEDEESNSVFEEEVNDDKPVGKSVLGTATEAVLDMVKKAANALVNKGINGSNDSKLFTGFVTKRPYLIFFH